MENHRRVSQSRGAALRDWIDPRRLYNPLAPAGRRVFLWGLAIYPVLALFLILTPVIILVESLAPGANAADYLGIVTWVLMLIWVAATVCICRRRLKDLGMSPSWVWLAIVPIANLFLFLYLLLKAGPSAGAGFG